MDIAKYVGRQLEIVYMDKTDKITQRRIEVRAIQEGKIRAYDAHKGPRTFALDRVLAAMPYNFNNK